MKRSSSFWEHAAFCEFVTQYFKSEKRLNCDTHDNILHHLLIDLQTVAVFNFYNRL